MSTGRGLGSVLGLSGSERTPPFFSHQPRGATRSLAPHLALARERGFLSLSTSPSRSPRSRKRTQFRRSRHPRSPETAPFSLVDPRSGSLPPGLETPIRDPAPAGMPGSQTRHPKKKTPPKTKKPKSPGGSNRIRRYHNVNSWHLRASLSIRSCASLLSDRAVAGIRRCARRVDLAGFA